MFTNVLRREKVMWCLLKHNCAACAGGWVEVCLAFCEAGRPVPAFPDAWSCCQQEPNTVVCSTLHWYLPDGPPTLVYGHRRPVPALIDTWSCCQQELNMVSVQYNALVFT